ncbi:hypothetical protein YQE_02986, partial [Dendroctonus ponderosae]
MNSHVCRHYQCSFLNDIQFRFQKGRRMLRPRLLTNSLVILSMTSMWFLNLLEEKAAGILERTCFHLMLSKLKRCPDNTSRQKVLLNPFFQERNFEHFQMGWLAPGN